MDRLKTMIALIALLMSLLLVQGAAAQEPVGQGPCGETVTVVAGDTLWSIAQRCNTSVDAILAANPEVTNPRSLVIGQVLQMPQPEQEPVEEPTVYVVKPGDWLSKIARQFNTTVERLLQLNATIENPNVIEVGMRIRVPRPEGQEPPMADITPAQGPPGTTVQVEGMGFPADTPVEIGLGEPFSEYSVIQTDLMTDAQGNVRALVEVPDWVEVGTDYVFVVTTVADPSIDATSEPFEVTAGDAEPAATVQVPLISLETGDIGCGDEVVFVERQVESAEDPLQVALQELLAIEEREYGQSGLINPLYRSDLGISEVMVEGGVATIRLQGEFLIGGVCDGPRVEAQFEQLALQYDFVNEVEVFINDQPLEELIGGA